MNLVVSLFVNAIAVLISAYLVPGVSVPSFSSALLVSVVLGVLNTILKPILIIFTLPVNILTLGLFTFVINAVIVLVVSSLVPSFMVKGLGSALLFSLVLSVVSSVLSSLKN